MTSVVVDLAVYRRKLEAERAAAREAASTIAGGNVTELRTHICKEHEKQNARSIL